MATLLFIEFYRRACITLSELHRILLNITNLVCVVWTDITLVSFDSACCMEFDDIKFFMENVLGDGVFVEMILDL